MFYVLHIHSLTLSDNKSWQQISRASLCGFNRVTVDMGPLKGDSVFKLTALASSCCCEENNSYCEGYTKKEITDFCMVKMKVLTNS